MVQINRLTQRGNGIVDNLFPGKDRVGAVRYVAEQLMVNLEHLINVPTDFEYLTSNRVMMYNSETSEQLYNIQIIHRSGRMLVQIQPLNDNARDYLRRLTE